MAVLVLILLFAVSEINAASIEPICPKFSYDEQLLEKMVRLEFFVENMQKDVKASVSESKNEVRDLQFEVSKNLTKTIEDFDVMFEALKANVTSATDATEVNLRGVIEGVQNKVEEMVNNMTKINDEILKGILSDVESHGHKFEETKVSLINSIKLLEGIIGEMKNMTATDNKAIKRITEDVESQERKFENFKTSFISSNDKVVKGIYEEMKKVENKIEDAKTSIEGNSLKTLEDLMDKKYPVVAFNVYKVVNGYSGTTMPFTTVRLNEGGGYSTETGKFTAPMAGIYQFNAHVCFEKGHETDYCIQAGTIKLSGGEYVVPNAASDGKCTSFSGVTLLQKSQTAYVSVTSGTVFVNNDDYNSFSGVLIRAI